MEFEDLYEYEHNDKHDFRYDLLSQGEFAYKYETNINTHLAIKYDLSRESKNIQKQDFEELGIPAGFEPETSTISKQYFYFDIKPYRPDGYRDLRKKLWNRMLFWSLGSKKDRGNDRTRVDG